MFKYLFVCMAGRYTIAINVMKEYENYVIDCRVKGPLTVIVKYYDWLLHKNIENKEKKKIQIDKKVKYMDFVYLSVSEYESLVNMYGEKKIKEIIERLNNYIGSKGDKYKSHYHTILIWFQKNGEKKIEYIKKEEKQEEFKPLTEEEKIQSIEILKKARNVLLDKK